MLSESDRINELEIALRTVIDIAQWMSGSSSFGPDGEAHGAWVNMARPQLKAAEEILYNEEQVVIAE